MLTIGAARGATRARRRRARRHPADGARGRSDAGEDDAVAALPGAQSRHDQAARRAVRHRHPRRRSSAARARQRHGRGLQHQLPDPLAGRARRVRGAVQRGAGGVGAGAGGGGERAGVSRAPAVAGDAHGAVRAQRRRALGRRSSSAGTRRASASATIGCAASVGRDVPRGHRALPHAACRRSATRRRATVLAAAACPSYRRCGCTRARSIAGTASATASATTGGRTCASSIACCRRARRRATKWPTPPSSTGSSRICGARMVTSRA